MSSRAIQACALALLMSLSSVTILPMAAGDGIPGYRIGDVTDPDNPTEFSSVFESRQLARVDLLNDDMQRISLFLSVYSLDPGKNLTIMVPLRTLPSEVTGEPLKESDFREDYKLDRAEEEVVRQDPDEAWDRFGEQAASDFETCFGSMLLTFPGQYLREHFKSIESDYYGDRKTEDSSGGDVHVLEPQPVQHYEFDGFSIDVFSVDAGPLLEDYLEEKGIVIPKGGGLEAYEGQYLAVVESEARPPVDPDRYDDLLQFSPETIGELEVQLRSDPTRDDREIWELWYDLRDDWYSGQEWQDLRSQEREGLLDTLRDLLDAVFGRTDFEGEVIHIDLPLDDGKMFFPLGTSAGWPNVVGDIDVLFRVPIDKDLEIDDTRDAYFDDCHWYLFSMENANPGFDLESPVLKGDEDRRAAAERAAWLYDNSPWAGPLLAILVIVSLWFIGAFLLMKRHGKEGPVLRNRNLWILLGLSLIISIPGALLVYLIAEPLPAKDLLKGVTSTTPLLMYPVALVAFALGGIL